MDALLAHVTFSHTDTQMKINKNGYSEKAQHVTNLKKYTEIEVATL
jgi:hypothetical protein